MIPDPSWMDVTLKSARPSVIAALVRHFGSVEVAEESYQEACLRALRNWPDANPPKNPAG